MHFLKEKKNISLGCVVVFIPLITYLLWLLFPSLLSSAEQKPRCLLITARGKVQQTGSLSSRSIYGCYTNFAKNTLPVLNSSKNKKHFNSQWRTKLSSHLEHASQNYLTESFAIIYICKRSAIHAKTVP